jgi:hypothetical protein
MVRLAALAALAALAITLPAGGAPGPVARVKNTSGWIESIGMDGGRVAYAVHSTSCTRVLVWNVETQGGAVVSGKQTCEADSTSTGGGVTQIAVAGVRVAWIVNLGGNTESDDYLYTASLPRPKERLLATAMRTGDVDGALAGGWIGGLVGDLDLLAVNTWQTDDTGGISAAALRRIDRSGLHAISSGLQTYLAASADAGRIAVARSDGTVALYTAAGKELRTIVPSSVQEVALQGGDLAVLTTARTLEVYSAATGKRRATWSVKPGATRLDVSSGRAVYAVDRSVHIIRLADGKDIALPAAPRAVEALAIETDGLVYAYNSLKGIKEIGNLAFVPMSKLSALLG